MERQLGQCTIRLANIRSGLRRITFKNERDNKENIMAVALVDIRIHTQADIATRIANNKDTIEVGSELSVDIFQDTFTTQRAIYEEKLPDLTPVQRGELAAQKGNSWVEVEIF